MSNPVYVSAFKFLSKKTKTLEQSDLFQYFLKNPMFCSKEQLAKDSQQELFSKIIFLGGYYLRKNFGPQIKVMMRNCLSNLKIDQMQLNENEKIQLFLGMSNLLVYDETIIQLLDIQLKQAFELLNTKQVQQISHCMYKLQVKDDFWSEKINQKIINSNHSMGISDLVQHIHIASNQYQMNQLNEQTIIQLIEILHKIYNHLERHVFMAKFQFQFVQLIYNLYPDTLQNDKNIICNSDNIFKNYVDTFRRDFQLCKALIDKRKQEETLDYFENDNFLNMIRIREFPSKFKSSKFEENIRNIMQKLQLQFEEQKRIIIYDIDYVVENKFIIGLNGPTHFIENIDGVILSKSPNYLMVKRHLEQLNKYKVVDIDYQNWEKYDTSQKYIQEFKNILNLL